jgi:uncharacterized protein (TIGR00297 family)
MCISDAPASEPTIAAREWQSRAILVLVLVAAAAYASLQLISLPSWRFALGGAAISLGFALTVLFARAATRAAALLGGLLTFCLALTPSSPHSPLWLLVTMLILTLGASRVGRRRKQAQGTAEGRHGRDAAQVAANLGVAALAGAAIHTYGDMLAHTALLAALGEATADTLASELGQLASAPPRMLLTWQRVAPGTDGAISLPGTCAGIAGAACLCLLARWAFRLPWWAVLLGGTAAVIGLFWDSFLGQVFERRGWLNNDAVNFISTLAAALIALQIGHFLA